MAIGRISGPLLKENLTRDGVNLRFEDDLLYLKVTDPLSANHRIGIKNSNPAYTLDITGTARATTILGGELDIDEIYINDNTISSQIGDLVLNAATISDKVTINNNVLINGNLHATGSITADGSLQLGDGNTDNVVFAADINSNFMPNITDTYILGGTGKRWLNGNFKFLEVGDIYLSNNTVASSITNGNLNLNGNGTGSVVINNSLTVGPGGSITMPGNFSVGGNLTVTGDIFGGALITDDIRVAGNTIETTSSNSNLELNTVGTGSIELLANSNVTGTFDVSSQATFASANVEDLTSGRVVLAGTSGELQDSANLTFNGTTLTVTGNETVTGTATLGNLVVNGTSSLTGLVTANGNVSVVGTLNVTGDIVGGPLRTDDIQIVGNRIETTASNSNFEINTVGTGTIELLANSNVTGTFGVSSLSTLAQVQVTDLTSGRVTFAGTSGRLQDSSALTFADGTLTVGTSVVVSGTAGDITMTGGNITGVNNISTASLTTSGNATITGTLTVTGDILGGPLRTDDIQIVGNRIETTASNSNFEINTVGTGTIELLANSNVTGTFDVSGQTTLASANVEDLTSGRVVLAGTNGELQDSAKLTFDGTTVSVTGNISVTGGTTSTINGITFTGTTLDTTDSSGITFTPLVTFSSDAIVENNLYVRNKTTTNDLLVEGNLTVLGTETVINSTSFSITDGLIYLGEDNQSDVVDLGFVASYNDGAYQHTGLVRDATDGKWKLFENVSDEPELTINFSQASYATLKLGTLEVDSILNSNLTTGRVVLAGVNGELEDSSNLTFDGTTLTITGDQHITGDLDVDGDITLGGNIRIGNQDVDTVTVVADFTSDLLPEGSNTYDLGRANKAWRTIYAGEFDNNTININDNTIKTIVSNANLELVANGTGNIVLANHVTVEGVTSTGATGTGKFVFDTSPTISGATLTNHVTVEGVTSTGATGTGNIVFSASPTVTGTLTVTGDQTVTGTTTTNDLLVNNNTTVNGTLYVTGDIVGGPLRTDDIQIVGNRIETTATNSNFEINTVGTGTIELLANSKVTGTFDVTGNVILGTTDADSVEVNADFVSNLVPNTTDTYNLGTTVKRWNQLNTSSANIGDVSIAGTTIQSTVLNSDLYLNANGSGSVIISNLLTLGSSGSLAFSGETVNFNNILIDGDGDYSVIRTIDSNTNLYLDAAGTGTINLTSNSNITGNLDVSSQATLASANVEDLTSGRVVLAGLNGELEDSNNLRFDGTTLTVTGDEYITGNLTVDGDITLGGNIRIGDTTLDTVTVQADFTSDLIPNASNTYDLGTSVKQWRTVNAAEFDNGVININDNVITTTVSNADLELSASGGGSVLISNNTGITGNLAIDGDVVVQSNFVLLGTSSVAGNGDFAGNVLVQGNLTVDGDLFANTSITTPEGTITTLNAGGANIDGIRIDTHVISTVDSNANLELIPNGSGIVYIGGTGAVRIPAGTTFERPATGEAGFIRYNSQTNNIEAWNGVVFTGISGGSSADANGDTLITFETAGNNEDIIRFFAGIAGATPGSTEGSNEIMQVSNDGVIISGTIKIQNNVIENINSNEDLIIRASGTGRVILDGSGEPGETGNVYATDPLLTLNSSQTSSNTYDSGLIIERGSEINVGFIWDESADEFAAVSTIEQGTVKGNVAITGYQDVSVASVKLNSETANKVTFTDANKLVRSLDSGRTAYIDGVLKVNTGGELAIPTGTDAQRPVAPQEGSVRYNTTSETFEGYAQSTWQGMGVGTGSAPTYQGIIADGVTYDFVLDTTPLSSAGILVTVNGVMQEPDYAYRVDDNILSFIDDTSTVIAPDAGDRIDVRFLSKPAVGTIREATYTGDGSTSTFASSVVIRTKPEIMVFVNNIYQDTAVYSISGKNVIFDQAPDAGDRINLLHICVVIAPQIPTSCFHGFTRNENGDLIYTKVSVDGVVLRDGDGNALYTEQYIGTSDGIYSINTNGQLIYTFDGY